MGQRAELCARLSFGLSPWSPPARPPGCAPAPPLTASHGRRRQRQPGTWAAGSRREGALAQCSSSALTSRRLAPPLECGGPVAAARAAPGRQQKPGQPPRRVPRTRIGDAREIGHLGRAAPPASRAHGSRLGGYARAGAAAHQGGASAEQTPVEGTLAECGAPARALTCGLRPPSILGAFWLTPDAWAPCWEVSNREELPRPHAVDGRVLKHLVS